MLRIAVGVTAFLGGGYVAEALLFQRAGDYPDNFPGSPLIGFAGLVGFGLVAGLLSRLGGLAVARG